MIKYSALVSGNVMLQHLEHLGIEVMNNTKISYLEDYKSATRSFIFDDMVLRHLIY